MDESVLLRNSVEISVLESNAFTNESRCRRVITPRGFKNIRPVRLPNKRGQFLADYFTTLLEAKWRWILLLYCLAFLGSWTAFGSFWWLIIYRRNDVGSGVVCIENVDSWTSAFLFSVESQTTIGYGGRQITSECPEAVVCLLLQSLCGLTLSASLLGLIYAKLARPRTRSQTIMFSRRAVIRLQDGKMCLEFRVADMRKNHLLNVSLRAYWLEFHASKHGFRISNEPLHLSLEGVRAENSHEVHPFLLLPNTVVHVIDDKSPFYELSPKNLLRRNFEIIVVLEGTIESSGLATQAKASFLPSEIEWGQRFAALMVKSRERGGFQVDMANFDRLYPVPLPSCSAKELDKWKKPKPSARGAHHCSVWIPQEQHLRFKHLRR